MEIITGRWINSYELVARLSGSPEMATVRRQNPDAVLVYPTSDGNALVVERGGTRHTFARPPRWMPEWERPTDCEDWEWEAIGRYIG